MDTPTVDTAEMVYISSLALLKMLKHGRAGVPMEVMGLMLGEFIDEYTVRVIDVFAMPQSGTVVIDAFRLINPQSQMIGQESRQTTSNIGHLNKPNIQALIHGLNRHYYSIAINYRKNELEQKMLLNLHKKTWTSGLQLQNFESFSSANEDAVKKMLKFTTEYNKSVIEEGVLSKQELKTRHVGKQDPKKHLEVGVVTSMTSNIVQCLGSMLDAVSF
ncbi:hypothetical protein HDU91_003595 [Kappamyces sp. JEL0680]|nr:hypothetical protein HDU91_003595 [Kappamyces sp. JEL0680]